MSSYPIKRKRGRPRRDEPREINDFDLSLIQDFESRPAFYDRSHQLHKNREYLEQQWTEMARNLGCTVSLIKNRMLQLRSRYTLEKRRIEALQKQYDHDDIQSPWKLFEHLSFLGGHLRARRSYTSRIRPNEMLDTALSNSSDIDEDDGSRQNGNASDDNYAENSVPVKRERRENAAIENHHNPSDQEDSNHGPADKYKAFGQFLVTSLIEMGENDALRLVDKFTTDVVQNLLALN